MKYYSVNFNYFLVSSAGVVAPLYTKLAEEQVKEFIPEYMGKHPLVAVERSRIVSGDFASDRDLVKYLEELVRQKKLCDKLGVMFRRVPDSLLQMPNRICRYDVDRQDMKLKRENRKAFDQAVAGYAKYEETHALWLEYIESVLG